MKRLSSYLFRQIAVLTLFVTVALTVAIWLTQSVRFLDIIINRGLPADLAARFLVLLMPSLLTMILPVALFIAVCFVTYKLTIDSELVVMRAAGLSNFRMARPALLLGLIVSCLTAGLTVYGVPASFRAFKELHRTIRDNHAQILLEAGVFTSVTGDVTVLVRQRTPEGGLGGVLVHDMRDPAKEVTYTATSGMLTTSEGQPRVILDDGTYQERDSQTGSSKILYFDRVVVDLADFVGERGATRRDPRELFIHELLRPEGEVSARKRAALRAEAHHRLAAPLYCLGFATLGAALLLTGDFHRRNLALRIGAAIALVVALEFASFGLADLAAADPRFVPFIYFVPVAALVLALAKLAGLDLRWRGGLRRPEFPRLSRPEPSSA